MNQLEKANPIIVADTSWGKTIPDWMYKQIQAERMINGMCELMSNKKLDHKDSVGDCETLVQHPALMTHSTYTVVEREKFGITDGLVRLSIGIESVQDIYDDLQQGLEKI